MSGYFICRQCGGANLSLGSDPRDDRCLDCSYVGNETAGRMRRIRDLYSDIDAKTLEWLFVQLIGDPSPSDDMAIDGEKMRAIGIENNGFPLGTFVGRLLSI